MLREKAPGVFIASGRDRRAASPEDIEALRRALPGSPRRRVRICLHDDNDPLQAMVILLADDGYVAPHRHLAEAESLTALDGRAGLVRFDDRGEVLDIVDFRPGGTATILVEPGTFHTLLPLDGPLLLHEARRGPFRPDDNQRAPWAPAEDDMAVARARYLDELTARVRRALPALP